MRPTLASILASLALASLGGTATAAVTPPAAAAQSPAVQELLRYLRAQNTTGFLVVQRGRTLIQENWPAPANPMFANFVYGTTADGQLLEDVASQQKSFVSVLVGVAIDRGLIDVDRPVSFYLGAGWSHASAEQEGRIRVIDVLTMSSGLDESFAYVAPAATRFFYNTAVYAVTKQILTRVTGRPLDQLTRDWLTAPLGMRDTAWRQRPPVFANVGNATGLVTTPRDSAIFGQMILAGGVAPDGRRIISERSLRAMFARSPLNPAYGRLWWLNGSTTTVRADGRPRPGQLIPHAPADLVGAFGLLDRPVYVVPSLGAVIVRTGAAATDTDFDDQLWQRLLPVLEPAAGARRN